MLERLDHIECRDALLSYGVVGADSGTRAGQTPGPHASKGAAKSAPTSALPAPRSDLSEQTHESGASSNGEESGVRSTFRTVALAEANNVERNLALTAVSDVARERHASEAPWPKASVVIGNPPFLGDKKMRSELGDDYTTTLRKVYEGRVPGGADLVCYWFEKARTAIEANGLGAAGLVATNGGCMNDHAPKCAKLHQS